MRVYLNELEDKKDNRYFVSASNKNLRYETGYVCQHVFFSFLFLVSWVIRLLSVKVFAWIDMLHMHAGKRGEKPCLQVALDMG
jgi:hypothetical protein